VLNTLTAASKCGITNLVVLSRVGKPDHELTQLVAPISQHH